MVTIKFNKKNPELTKAFDNWWKNSPYRIGYVLGSGGHEPEEYKLNIAKIAFEAGADWAHDTRLKHKKEK